jgi:hypothetical protein
MFSFGYRELVQEFLRFPQRVGLFEDLVAANRARYRCNEFNDRLMRQAHGVLHDAAPKNLVSIFCIPANLSSNR